MSLWTDPATSGGVFRSVRKGPRHLEAVYRLKELSRSRFGLARDEVVIVKEIAGSLPGVPLRQTVVVFWTKDGTRHHLKIFKPVQEVVVDDLPPAWLMESLAVSEGFECECC